MDCPICQAENEEILWQSPNIRVIAVHNEANAPAFCRVIWQAHVAEMTDLPPESRRELMDVVYRVEAASLGNVVPHLHWHVVARFDDDACFPAPIWANAVREARLALPEDWSNQVKRILQAA